MDYNQSGGIDLHIHSTASDGTVSPSDILTIARQNGLSAIAITDHDTLAGCRKILQNGIPAGLIFLNGVEISANPTASYPGSGSFHILGYGIDIEDAVLNRMLTHLQESRKNRNPAIIERLASLGIDINLAEVKAISGRGQIGRPHIARALLKKGIVSTMNMAFDRFLGYGKPAYVEKARVDCREAVHTIQKAGGIAVLAHPGLLTPSEGSLFEEILDELIFIGLDGVEVFYPEHGDRKTSYYSHLAKKKGLQVTGGTDFHGANKPDVQIGNGCGKFHIPFSVYTNLTFQPK